MNDPQITKSSCTYDEHHNPLAYVTGLGQPKDAATDRIAALETALATLERRHNAVEDAMGCHDHQPFWESLAKQREVNAALLEWLEFQGYSARAANYAAFVKLHAALRDALK